MGKQSSLVEFYSPHSLWSVSHRRCRQESVSLHLLNPLPMLTAFRRPIQTSHSLNQYAPIPRPRQPASFQSTVGQISPDHCYQSPVPVTKVTQPQSVLPNSNQLVQTMPSLAANVPATHHSCCIIPIQHQSAATFETSKPTASATPASLY